MSATPAAVISCSSDETDPVSVVAVTSVDVVPVLAPTASVGDADPVPVVAVRPTPATQCQSDTDTINILSPLPKSHVAKIRKRKCDRALLLTGSPFKKRLEEMSKQKQGTRQTKGEKKNKKVEKKQTEKKKKKKKQICRADKPRGRKPKNAGRPIKPTVKQLKVKGSKSNDMVNSPKSNSDTECLICGELFSKSRPREQWIKCLECSGWCHYDCTSGESSRGFVCEFCH